MAKRRLEMKSLLLTFLLLGSANAATLDQSAVVNGWLARQTNVQTWAADFTQTRTLKSLRQPLVSTGQVWFAAPHNFRWELAGQQTIAIRQGDSMTVAYPRLKRAERYNFENSSGKGAEWRDTLALLQTGFPQSEAQLREQFNILSLAEVDGVYKLELQPKSSGARKMMPQINVFLEPKTFSLAGTELIFIDGSRMRNDFSNIRTNIDVASRFEYQIPAGFKVVTPLDSP